MGLGDCYPESVDVPESRLRFVRLLGTGAAAPTVETGRGVTCTRTSIGLYKLTWAEQPGAYVGLAGVSLEAATPADLVGHSVIADTYDATTRSIELRLANNADAAHDLAALEWINLTFRFKQTSAS